MGFKYQSFLGRKALGNYLYRKYTDYLKNGNSISSGLNALQRWNNEKYDKIDNYDDKTIEKINSRIQGRLSNIKQLNYNSKLLQEEIIQNLNNKIATGVQNRQRDYSINASAQDFFSMNGLDNSANKIINLINEICRLVNSINAKSNNTTEKVNSVLTKLDQKITQLQKERNTIYNDARKQLKNIVVPSSEIRLTAEQLKNIRDQLYFIFPFVTCASDIKGWFGEMVVAASLGLMDLTATDAINQSVVGGQASNMKVTQIDAVRLRQELDKRLNVQEPQNGVSYFLGRTQNKIDVRITFNDPNLPPIAQVKASVKAYTGIQSPKLQSINLFTALEYLERFNKFGTHWLNIQCGAEATSDMDDQFKKFLALQALAYGSFYKRKQNAANTFIYIDIDTGKVVTFSTKILLDDLRNFNFNGSGLNIQSIRDKNRFEDSIEDRIFNVLMHIHKLNIDVSLSSTAIRNAMS